MRRRLTRVALAALAIVLLGAGAAQALRLNIGNSAISVTANFLPRELPEHTNAPVSVTSITRIKTSDGSQPSALKQIVFQFDKHGALDTKGLPTCTMAKLADTTPQEARKRCAGALVGTGTGRAEVTLPGAPPVQISSPLSFFNAPPIGGKPILIAHAYETIPTPKAVLVPMVIEKIKHGRYGYQVKIPLPPIADGYGVADPRRSHDRRHPRARRQDRRLHQRPLRRRSPAGSRHALLRERGYRPRHPVLAMPPAALRFAALLACTLGLTLLSGIAGAATVEYENLVLHADGGFAPRTLPRKQFAPIDFKGHVDILAKAGGRPSALRKVVLDFDHDGKLDSAGLPTCPPERIAQASTEEARRLCKGAIVGSGRIDALISLASGPVPASSPLTLFNGPPLGGQPTVVLHARTTVPGTQTFAILVPIERRHGEYGYRATLEVPPIAAGLGSITHVNVEIGRRFGPGNRRSYVAARCSDNILRTRGRFSFEDGIVIDGNVEKFCRDK